MRKIWLKSLSVGLAMLLLVPASKVLPENEKAIRYESRTLPSSVVHTLLLPAPSQFSVTLALSPELDTVENFAQKYQAIAVLNGGFFDPVNHKSTSKVIQTGRLVADPRLNSRLMSNPDNAPYLDKILNRTEFRQYLCGQTVRYEIALHSQPTPKGCQLIDAIGGGPRLLPEITLQKEGFLEVTNGQVIRDVLGSSQPNARTAVGITRDGSVIWVMVAQKPEAPTSSGMSLPALADFMKTIGVESAMNLDGGSSSSLYYRGKTFYGKVNRAGNQVKRPVKSVLLVQAKY